MLQNRKVVVTQPGQVAFQTEKMPMPVLPAGHALVKNHYSLISTGTEIACVNGLESSWFVMPAVPGYCSVGEICAVAGDVTEFCKGDIVYNFSGHQEYSVMPVSGCFMKIPEGIEEKYIPFVRMATIAAGAIRASNIELGDFVGVTGQGMIGIMAAQLAHLQGAFAVGIDRHESRLAVARQMGVDYTINPKNSDTLQKIEEYTAGHRLDTLIEAIGNTQVAAEAAEYMAKNGEIILTGTPRTNYVADLSKVFFKVFHEGSNIRFKGAHEWKDACEPDRFVKHSIVRNSEIVLRLMQTGRLLYKPLLTHLVRPEDCAEVYQSVASNKDAYLGVVFDWNK